MQRVEELREALTQLRSESEVKEKSLHERARQSVEDQDSHNSALKAVKEELVKGQERLLVEHRRLCELQRDLSDAESRERQLSNLINSTEDKKSDTLDESGKAEALLSL